MGVPQAMEAVAARAALIRDSMERSQTVTDSMVAILGSFDHRLSALETAMRPTQIRTHSIRRAHENINETVKRAEVILGQFEISCKKLKYLDLKSVLEAIGQLRSTIDFFKNNKNLKNSDGVINHANNLLTKAIKAGG